MEECLDNDPAMRPAIVAVRERIQASKDDYMKEYPLDVIALCQQGEQKDGEIKMLKSEVDQLKLENDSLKVSGHYNITKFGVITLVLFKKCTNRTTVRWSIWINSKIIQD